MMSSARIVRANPVNIIGAGLAGALLALLLARRGFAVTLHERRPDPRQETPERGRSINLVLAARGMRALQRAGLLALARSLLIPLRGRMIHDGTANPVLQPYGQREHEVIWSVGRTDLNRMLIEAAAGEAGVRVHFNRQCLGADLSAGTLQLRDTVSGDTHTVPLATTIGTDGAGSALRAALVGLGLIGAREERLDHDYKELTIPAVAGRHALDPHALHIWPRGGFMLIALPNTDATFTATLFLPRTGAVSFAALDSALAAQQFFASEFPDVLPLMPRLATEFAAHPQGMMGTVHASPWHVGGQVLLLGDAAHAIVPFHGQGMNAAFEDCVELDLLLESIGGTPDSAAAWEALFARFETQRRSDTAAIAQMALENYLEMRDTVRDPHFLRLKELTLALERRFPDRFIPRYSMVMFHPQIRYAEALRRGEVQARILAELGSAATTSRPAMPAGESPGDSPAASALAERLVLERLAPLAAPPLLPLTSASE